MLIKFLEDVAEPRLSEDNGETILLAPFGIHIDKLASNEVFRSLPERDQTHALRIYKGLKNATTIRTAEQPTLGEIMRDMNPGDTLTITFPGQEPIVLTRKDDKK